MSKLVAGAVGALWFLATPASAFEPRVPQGYFGVSAPELVEPARNGQDALLDRHAAAMGEAGLDWARITFDWRLAEPTPPPVLGSHVYDWAWTDRLVGALARHRVSVLPTPVGAPLWARDLSATLAGCGGNAAVAAGYAQAFGDYVEAIVRRYGRDGVYWSQNPQVPYRPVKRVEVWNEPNWQGSWCPGPDPEAFAPVLGAAARGIRRADPGVEVVLGGLVTIKQSAFFAGGGLRGMRTDEFLERLVARDPQLPNLVDTVGIHLYESDPSENLSLLGWLRRTLGSVGMGDAEMLITEFGWSTSGAGAITEDERARSYRGLMDVLPRTDCGVSGIAAHSWFTFETDVADPVHWFGIVDPDSAEPYPTAIAYADMVRLWNGAGAAPPPREVLSVCNAPAPDQDQDGAPDESDDYPFDPARQTGANEPPPASEEPPPEPRTMAPRVGDEFFGATDVWLPVEGPARQAHYDAMRDAGLGRIRQQLQWRNIETATGGGSPTYSWAETDRRVLALARRGIRMVPVMINARSGLPTDLAAVDDSYAALMGALAERYGSEGTYWDENGHLDRSLAVRDYEVWQAGNAAWGAWDGTPSAAEHAQTYKKARAAVRAADPNARAILSLVDHADGGSAGNFIRSMAQADPALRGGIDGVYVMANSARSAVEAEAVAADVRGALEATGNPGAKLYVGFGAWTQGSGAMPEPERAGMVREIAEALPRSDCGIDGAFVYAWATRSEDPANTFDWYGIASLADASLQPSGVAMRDAVRSFLGYGSAPAPRAALHGCFKQAPDSDRDGVPDAGDSHPLDPAQGGPAPAPPGAPAFSSGPSLWSSARSAVVEYSAAGGESYQCRIDGSGWSGCGPRYEVTGLAEGGHSLVVRAVDSLGIVGPSSELRWNVDTRAPTVSIASGPGGLVLGDDVAFQLASDEPGSTFRCQLDSEAWRACDSNARFEDVSDGYHMLRVHAVDRAGNQSGSYAARGFETRTIPRTPAILSITGTPGQSPTARFEAAFAVSYECRYDEEPFAPCSAGDSHVPAAPLSHGSHRFYVRGVGATGKPGPFASAPVSVVDARAPETSITSGPSGTVLSDSVNFAFAADEANVQMWCRLDATAWSPCPADGRFSALGDGPHVLRVAAVDLAGNTDATPIERTFDVRTTPAATEILTGPAEGGTATPSPRFGFRADYALGMECRFDTGPFKPCSGAESHVPSEPLPAGAHTFEVRGIGGTGKIGIAALRSFTVVPEASEPLPALRCRRAAVDIVGTPGPDVIMGTEKSDVIAGLGGSDVIRGRGGSDLICSGDGADYLNGGSGSDSMLAGAGRDRCVGGTGKNRLVGCERS